jgi:integrase
MATNKTAARKAGRPRKNPYKSEESVRECGITVTITRRPGSSRWQMLAYVPATDDKGKRVLRTKSKTAGTDDLAEATERAKGWASEIAKGLTGASPLIHRLRLLVAGGYILTIGECIAVYEEVELAALRVGDSPRFFASRWADVQALKACLPMDLPASDYGATVQDEFIAKRRKGGFFTVGPKGKPAMRGPADDDTVCGDLNTLGRVFNVALDATKIRGRMFLNYNPALTQVMKDRWPVKGKKDRPILTFDHTDRMIAAIPTVESMMKIPVVPGMIRTLFLQQEYSGRRVGTTRGMRIRAILRTHEEMVDWLMRNSGEGARPEFADHWPHGAIVYNDGEAVYGDDGLAEDRVGEKMSGNTALIVPMSRRQRKLFDEYLATHPDADNPDAWLFPNPSDRSAPVTNDQIHRWFRACESYAGIPHIKRLGFHGSRRNARSIRPTGEFDTELVELVIGWKTTQQSIANNVYLKYGPRAIFECMDFDPRTYFAPESGRVPGVSEAVLAHNKARRDAEDAATAPAADPEAKVTVELTQAQLAMLQKLLATETEEAEAVRRREAIRTLSA